jgi:pimeloyl-ACP methyl ester carboxylesterase
VQPETKFARLGGDRIAYQVLGEGPPDLVLARRSYGHIDVAWEDPGITLFLRTLASFCRLILFDRRGTGPSDPLPLDPLPPWESYAEELAAVLDEVGCERAAIMAELDAGPTALLFAGTRPERTGALVLVHTSARFVAGGDYPIGVAAEDVEALVARFDQLWGSDTMAAMLVPSRAGDARFLRWFAKWQRASVSPRAAQAFLRAMAEVDVRPVLPLVQAPTLILHRRGFGLVPIEHGRYLAEHIAGAKLVELPGSDVDLSWEAPELALDEIQEFLTGLRRTVEPSRVLATVLFTDIVGSTERAARVGIGAGGNCRGCTTSLPAGWSRSSAVSSSRRPATASWRPSTAPAARSAARPPLARSWAASACRSGRGCTPARSSCATATSAASRSTSRRG